MISAGDFRNGVTIELEGNIYQIIEFQCCLAIASFSR